MYSIGWPRDLQFFAILHSFRPSPFCKSRAILVQTAMAGKGEILSTNPQCHISRYQYDSLLASHKVFRDAAIRVIDILQDPSRISHYQSIFGEAADGSNTNYTDHRQYVLKDDSSDTRQQSGGVMDYSKRSIPPQQERKPAPGETIAPSAFALENTRARKVYRQRRQRSINLYASTSVSYLDTEYDFQFMLTS